MSVQVEHSFVYDWVLFYGIPNVILSDNSQHFVNKPIMLLHLYLKMSG